MFEVICITFAFFFGLAVRQVGLPPLVGFLAADFPSQQSVRLDCLILRG
jgi:predicted Kef-type K+ transport protein